MGRMGRPPIGPKFQLRVRPDVWAAIEARRKKTGRTRNDEVRALIDAGLRAVGEAKPGAATRS